MGAGMDGEAFTGGAKLFPVLEPETDRGSAEARGHRTVWSVPQQQVE